MKNTDVVYVDPKDLLQALEIASHGLSTREMIEQGQCFRIKGKSIVTFNDEIMVKTKSPVPLPTVSIPAQALLGMLRKTDAEKITISLQGENEIEIRTKREVININAESNPIFPDAEIESPVDWSELPSEFFEALETVAASASNDSSEPIITYVHITDKYMVATDGSQICAYKINTGLENCLVKKDTAKVLSKLGLTKVASTNSWLHFKNETNDLIVACRKSTDPFIEIMHHTKMENPIEITFPKSVISALEKAEIFTSEDAENNYVEVELKEDTVSVSGSGSLGRYRLKPMECPYSGNPIKFSVTPSLLKKIIDEHNTCEIDESGALKLRVRSGRMCYMISLEQPHSDNDVLEEGVAE